MDLMGRKDTRITITSLRHGQPRPYADTEDVYRILIERIDWKTDSWKPESDAGRIMRLAKAALKIPNETPKEWWMPRVDYISHVLKNGELLQDIPDDFISETGIVEVLIRTPYDD